MTAPADTPRLPGSPYVGLGNFTERQSAFFFGREADIKRIIGNLRVARLTLLYAESGVGKSSVLRAGVAARLDELATAPGSSARPSDLPVIFSSWTSDPLPALIDAIGRAIEPFVDGPLQLPHDSLEGAIEEATRLAERDLLVILDQFEEYFSYQAHDGADRSFPDQIAQCINRRDLRANILISIREDAYARLGDLLKARVANVYANYLHLDYLDAVAARDAIVKPVQRWNELHGYDVDVDVEPALVDTVVEQVRLGAVVTGEHELTAEGQLRGDESAKIETTYLQLVMKRLWDEESAAGSHVLRLETLQSLGGAQQIIGTHLDTAMAELTPEQQAVAADVFRFLVTRTGMKIAFSSADLADMSGRSTEEVAPVLSRLSGADLHILRSVAMPDDGQGSNYEIFHDALAQPIRDWRSRYLRGQVEEQQKLELERQQAQLAATRAQLRRARRRWVVLSAVSVLLAGLLVATFALWRRSEDLSHRSKSADLAAQALSEGSSPERSLQLATQAVDEAKTPEALLAVRAALAKPHVSFSSGPLGSYLEDTQVDRHGDWLAVGADNGTWLWNTRTGASRSLEGEPKGPVAIHFSADGSRLLVVDFFAPRVFDMHGRNVGGELTAPPDRGFWVDGAISRDGQRVLLLAGSGVVLQNSDGSGSTTLAVDGPRIVTAQFLAGGRFVTISEDNVLTVWSPDGTKEATRAGVAAYAASPDGSILAAGTHDGVVHLWRVPDMTQITSFPTPDEIEQLLFDDQRAGTVTAVGAHGTVSILDPAQPDQFPRVVRTGEQIDPNGVAGSARPLLMTSGSGSLAIWDTQVGTPLERFDLSGRIFDLRLADDGSYSFVQVSWVKGANDQATAVLRARLWEGRTVSVAASLPEDAGQASFSRDHRHVVVVYQQPEGYAVEVRASPDLAPAKVMQLDPPAGTSGSGYTLWAGTDKNADSLVTLGQDYGSPATTRVEVWDPSTGAKTRELPDVAPGGLISAADLSPDGSSVLVAWGDFTTGQYHLDRVPTDGSPPARLVASTGHQVLSVTWAPDGRFFVVTGDNGGIDVYRYSERRAAATKTASLREEGRASPVTAIAVSNGSRFVAAGSEDGRIVLWDRRSGSAVRDFDLRTGVAVLGFDTTGRYLLADGANTPTEVFATGGARELNALMLVDPIPEPPDQAADFVSAANTGVWSTDGRYMLRYPCVACVSEKALLAEAGKRLAKLHGH